MPLSASQGASADAVRSAVTRGALARGAFREALESVPAAARDAWVDRVLGIEATPEDASDLPRGCTPYLPCAIDALVHALDGVEVGPDDVFVDLGSGLGRAAIVAHLYTGASAVGIEVQRHLAEAARALTASLGLRAVATVHGDAVALGQYLPIGNVFFFYCPFGRDRLEAILDALAPLGRARPVRICTVDLPLPPRDWLVPLSSPALCVEIFRSLGPAEAASAANARR